MESDLAGPLNTNGGYGNAAGGFDLSRKLKRASRSTFSEGDDAMDRYFGSFSLESKRHVWDLLAKHPQFQAEGNVRKNRIINNTREVLPGDPHKQVINGGFINYLHPKTNDTKDSKT